MDRYDASKHDESLSELERIEAGPDRRNSTAERIDASAATAAAGLSPGFDPTWWTAMRVAEHQYLMDRRDHFSKSGLDPATLDALEQVPATAPAIRQVNEWAQGLLGISQQVSSVF